MFFGQHPCAAQRRELGWYFRERLLTHRILRAVALGAPSHSNLESLALKGRQAGSRPKDSFQPQRKPRGLKCGDARHSWAGTHADQP